MGKLVQEPNELLMMSVAMGVDMTPNADLEERLDAMIKYVGACSNDLDVLLQRVEKYASTVKGLDIAEIRAKALENDNV
jgi:hypothetical protein